MKKIALENIIFIPEYHENQIYSYHSGKIEEDVDKESPIGGLIMSMHDRYTEEKLGYVHFIIAESADFIDMDGESSELGMAYVAAQLFYPRRTASEYRSFRGRFCKGRRREGLKIPYVGGKGVIYVRNNLRRYRRIGVGIQ